MSRAIDQAAPDPPTQVLLQIMAAKTPAIWTLTADEARRIHDPLTVQSAHRAPLLHRVEDIVLVGRIPGRCYQAEPSAAPGLLIFFHGGGGVIGNLDTHDAICRTLCASSGLAVLSVAYRLGPEYRFPAAWEDAWAVWCWAQENLPALGAGTPRLCVGGDSAGGGLAAAVARDAALVGIPCAAQLLLYPALDATRDARRYPSVAENAAGYFLTKDLMNWFNRHYLTPSQDRAAPALSPALSPDLQRPPPCVLVTAGLDPLRDEGLHYRATLQAAGGIVEHFPVPATIHGFLSMGRFLPQAEPVLKMCGKALARLSAS